MGKAQIKEQLKSVLRAVIDSTGLTAKNDKWITIHPNGEEDELSTLAEKEGELVNLTEDYYNRIIN